MEGRGWVQSFFSRCQPTRKEYIFLVEAEESLLFRWILSDQPSLPPRSSESFLCLCSFFRPSSTFRTKSVLLSFLGKGETPRGTEAPRFLRVDASARDTRLVIIACICIFLAPVRRVRLHATREQGRYCGSLASGNRRIRIAHVRYR